MQYSPDWGLQQNFPLEPAAKSGEYRGRFGLTPNWGSPTTRSAVPKYLNPAALRGLGRSQSIFHNTWRSLRSAGYAITLILFVCCHGFPGTCVPRRHAFHNKTHPFPIQVSRSPSLSFLWAASNLQQQWMNGPSPAALRWNQAAVSGAATNKTELFEELRFTQGGILFLCLLTAAAGTFGRFKD